MLNEPKVLSRTVSIPLKNFFTWRLLQIRTDRSRIWPKAVYSNVLLISLLPNAECLRDGAWNKRRYLFIQTYIISLALWNLSRHLTFPHWRQRRRFKRQRLVLIHRYITHKYRNCLVGLLFLYFSTWLCFDFYIKDIFCCWKREIRQFFNPRYNLELRPKVLNEDKLAANVSVCKKKGGRKNRAAKINHN